MDDNFQFMLQQAEKVAALLEAPNPPIEWKGNEAHTESFEEIMLPWLGSVGAISLSAKTNLENGEFCWPVHSIRLPFAPSDETGKAKSYEEAKAQVIQCWKTNTLMLAMLHIQVAKMRQ